MIRSLLATASLSGISAIASRGAVFAGVLTVAWYLGPAGFGQFTLIQTTALLFTTFCALSLGQMASKIVAEAVAAAPERVAVTLSVAYGSALLLSLALAGLVVALSRPLAVAVGGSDDLAAVYASAGLLVFTGFMTAIQNGVALALQRVRQQALANLACAPLVFLIMLLAATRRDLAWAVYGYVAAQAVIVVAQERVLLRYRREHGLRLRFAAAAREDWAVVWRLGLPSSLAGLLTVPAMWLAMVMLARGPGGETELGQFALGNQARTILLFGVGVVANAALPMLSSAMARGDAHRAAATFHQSIALSLAATATIAVAALLAAPPLIAAFAPAYADATGPLAWLLLSVVVAAPTTIMMRRATAEGRPGVLLVGNAVFSAVLLGAAFAALRLQAGAGGVAAAVFAATLAQLLAFWLLGRDGARLKAPAGSRP
ncbi:oligosaccharide flippase family protein [Luteimonas sp. SJ-92]|uniref:Oligosaccharide flippase family protein n=1 Tax=Luteimonas salinisoli TaxID=2752307 RepID=A0A853JB02_9GAMM|nr:oligosaccharide flippase family protein [Luteimonas salinisoli]NZA25837.1 oligosaccharide flippase family protein [Luteimonas salinisoli]